MKSLKVSATVHTSICLLCELIILCLAVVSWRMSLRDPRWVWLGVLASLAHVSVVIEILLVLRKQTRVDS